MQFDDWRPVYERILADFGYGHEGDEQARDQLGQLLAERKTFDPAALDYRSKTVAIAGGAATLTEEIEMARDADRVVAASVAADRLREQNVSVDCMITDLDKNPETTRDLASEGVPVAVHAHGDNIPAVEEWVPALDAGFVIPTTQAAPAGPVRNFGGFTDGDRAAFFADEFGAGKLVFPGWSFDDPTVSAEKRQKLGWAERLLYLLERRRDERFSVLDGRRGGIETDVLPVE